MPKGAINCVGDYVAPGLIELHTDNLERHIQPRPKVTWARTVAIVAHDAELASTGITTVFDALRVGSIEQSVGHAQSRYARKLATDILALRDFGQLKISHHLHLRSEICSQTLKQELAEFDVRDRIGIVSLMDHTPGQRQFTDLSKYENLTRGKYGLQAGEFKAHVALRVDLQAELGAGNEAAAVAAAKRFGATLASHDDTTIQQVATSRAHGVTLAEFPTNLAVAEACRAAGIAVIMGAPNLVRGGSHSNNISALELVQAGLLDILWSDYVPPAMLLVAWQLGQLQGNIATALATVTAKPAAAVGLLDRGVLEIGRRADLIRFGHFEQTPTLRGVWVHGQRVA